MSLGAGFINLDDLTKRSPGENLLAAKAKSGRSMYLQAKKSAGGACLRLSLNAIFLGMATGCTILAPIQTPESDRRFALHKNAGAQANLPCMPVNLETPGECKPLEQDIDAFHGGLGRALWETDVRRRELIAQAASHTNINSAYNALLWPLGSYFIAKKIRHPEWSTLDVAAVAAASFGFLGSGIPDRDQLYVKTAARMACSIALFDADLYPKTEIRPDRFAAPVHKSNWHPSDAGDPAWLRHKLSDETLVERLPGSMTRRTAIDRPGHAGLPCRCGPPPGRLRC